MSEPTKETGLAKRDLPEPVQRRGITEPQWVTLANNLYPGANPKSVLMVWDYCAARKLDPMKKPVHIVQMDVRLGDGSYEKRDVVLPGIYEYRITAHRTGEYLGHDKPAYGELEKFAGVDAPASCEYTAYRWNPKAGMKVAFTVEVLFREVVATKRDGNANQRWARAPQQMLTKCAEAAALREAFPEEIGGEQTAEEMDGHSIIEQATVIEPSKAVSDFDTLPEPLRDRIEAALTDIGTPAGLRLAKINQFIGQSGKTAEEGAEELLVWCREEFKKGKKPAAKDSTNGNAKKPQEPSKAAEPVQAKPEEKSAPAPTVAPQEVKDAELMPEAPSVNEIPFGNQGQGRKAEGEWF